MRFSLHTSSHNNTRLDEYIYKVRQDLYYVGRECELRIGGVFQSAMIFLNTDSKTPPIRSSHSHSRPSINPAL